MQHADQCRLCRLFSPMEVDIVQVGGDNIPVTDGMQQSQYCQQPFIRKFPNMKGVPNAIDRDREICGRGIQIWSLGDVFPEEHDMFRNLRSSLVPVLTKMEDTSLARQHCGGWERG